MVVGLNGKAAGEIAMALAAVAVIGQLGSLVGMDHLH